MGRAAKYGIVALLCGASLLVGATSGWWLRGPPRGTKQLLDILADMEPKPSTEAQWKAVAVDRSTANVSGVELPVATARNLRPVLEADGNLSAHHIEVVNTRSADAVKTTISSIKANNALDLDWVGSQVEKAACLSTPRPSHFVPDSVPSRLRYRPGYLIGTIGGGAGGVSGFTLKTPAGSRNLAWDRQTFTGDAYFLEDYRYAATPECPYRNGRKGDYTGLVIMDLLKLDIAGFVPLPPQVGRYAPLLIIDPKTDLLLCFDLDVAWIVCVDLRPARLAAEAAEKQAPAPEKKEAEKR